MTIFRTAGFRGIKNILVFTGVLFLFFVSCRKTSVPTAVIDTVYTATLTATAVISGNATVTATLQPASTATLTRTPSHSVTATPSVEQLASGTVTETGTWTLTRTTTATPVSTLTATETITSTVTITASPTVTVTASLAATAMNTPFSTHTFTHTQTASNTPTVSPTMPPANLGSVVISPMTLYGKTTGNEIEFKYTAGDVTWAASPGSGTFKITVPSGWSPPSLDPMAPGYFSVAVEGGALLGKGVSGMDILVTVRNLAANTGQITVKYGNRSFGPGAFVDGAGLIIIPVAVDEDGSNTTELASSPIVNVIPATPTITPTHTPIVGEGHMTVQPNAFVDGSQGNTLEFTFTAGVSAWSSAGGTIRITLPAGFSPPNLNFSNPGYFYVTATGCDWVTQATEGQDIILSVSRLVPLTGQVKIYYGYKNFGGPGAVINGAGAYTLVTKTDTDGFDVHAIANSPVIYVMPPTSTVTMTHTVTPTITETHTITKTQTITETHTVTETYTITETHTITTTRTASPTVTATPTFTATPTPFWDFLLPKGFSGGRAEDLSLAVYNGIPYVSYSDWTRTQRATLMKFEEGLWQSVGPRGFTPGIAYETSLFVYGGIPYMAFRDYNNGANKLTTMRYAEHTGGWEYVWQREYTPAAGFSPSLYVYADEPFTAFRDAASSGRVSLMKYRYLAGWEYAGAAGFSDGTGSDVSLSFNAVTGEPYVAYRDWANGYRATVKKLSAGAWQTVGTQGFSAGGAQYISLHLYQGVPYVAYMDVANGNRATVMTFNGTSWSRVGNAGFTQGTAEYLSLYVYNGTPFLAYRDWTNGRRATVARYNGTLWETIAVVSDGDALFIKMKFDEAAGSPYVAFQDAANSYGVTVAKYQGSF